MDAGGQILSRDCRLPGLVRRAAGAKLRVDDPTLPETEVGPLIRHKEVFSATPSIHACNQTFTNGR
jgi:hypothetical protein